MILKNIRKYSQVLALNDLKIKICEYLRIFFLAKLSIYIANVKNKYKVINVSIILYYVNFEKSK